MATNISEKISILNQTTLKSLTQKNSLEVIKEFTEAGLKIMGADFGFAWWKLVEDKEHQLAYKSQNTPYEPNLPREKGGNYTARKNKSPIFISSVKSENYESKYDVSPYMASYAIIPIYYNTNLYGSLILCYKQAHTFSEDEISLCSALGNSTAQAITINQLLKKEQLALKEAKKQEVRFRALIENSYDAILIIDEQNKILDVSNSATNITGYSVEKLLGMDFTQLIHSDDTPSMQLHMKKILEEINVSHSIQFRYRHNDNSWRWMEVRNMNLIANPNIQGIVTNLRDITERKATEAAILNQTLHDPLTNLFNRTEMTVRLEQLIELAKRHHTLLAVLYLDLDRFKNINDGLGHNVGDTVLKVVASRLQSSVRAEDTVARIGGDEFVILLSEINFGKEALVIAEKILKAIALPVQIGEITVHPSVSIGIAVYPEDATNSETLIRYADIAVYKAKESGRGRCKLFNNTMHGYDSQKFAEENELRLALKENQIKLYYQPIIDLKKQKLTTLEVVSRWQHPKRGLLPPNKFIGLAEETGLILELDEYVLRTACIQLKLWRETNMPKFRISVNLSAKQFTEYSFIPMLTKILAENFLDAQNLEFEITETMAMNNLELTNYNLKALKKLGIRITIDDFGTGYSSFSYLKRFPINQLKIDKTFIRHCITNEQDGSITRAIIAMAHNLNLKVVAEGVETEQQLNFLASLGCDAAQGFYIAQPMPAEQLLIWLEKKNNKQQSLSLNY